MERNKKRINVQFMICAFKLIIWQGDDWMILPTMCQSIQLNVSQYQICLKKYFYRTNFLHNLDYMGRILRVWQTGEHHETWKKDELKFMLILLNSFEFPPKKSWSLHENGLNESLKWPIKKNNWRILFYNCMAFLVLVELLLCTRDMVKASTLKNK